MPSNKKITDLPAISAAAPGDLLALVDVDVSNTTSKTTVQQLAAGLPAATASAAGTMAAADKAKLDASTASATASTLALRDGSGNTAVNVLTAASVTISQTPTASTDAATKGYVDGVAVGLTIKTPCRLATTANVATLSGGAPLSVDGVNVAGNDRILVKDQSTASQNGIYSVTTAGSGSNGTWARATDADTSGEVPTGTYTFVTAGSTYGSTSWVMNTAGPITLGTTGLTWVIFSQIASIPAANITGTLTTSQIADAAVSTAKFAAGIRPVEIVSTVPLSGNFQGRIIYLTTIDGSFAANKLYRWTDTSTTGNTFWVSTVPAVDLTGSITSSQVTDGAISTPKLAANCVTAAKIAAGTITANEIAADSLTAGVIAAGAIGTSELAVGGVTGVKIANNTITAGNILAGTITATEIAGTTITGAKIAAGTITAGLISVANLAAITANLGTVTAGSITASATIDIGSSENRTRIQTTGLTVGGVTISGATSQNTISISGTYATSMTGGSASANFTATNGSITAIVRSDVSNVPSFLGSGATTRFGTSSAHGIEFHTNGSSRLSISSTGAIANAGSTFTVNTSGDITGNTFAAASGCGMDTAGITVANGKTIQSSGFGHGSIDFNFDSLNCINVSAAENGGAGTLIGYWKLRLNSREVKIPIYND